MCVCECVCVCVCVRPSAVAKSNETFVLLLTSPRLLCGSTSAVQSGTGVRVLASYQGIWLAGIEMTLAVCVCVRVCAGTLSCFHEYWVCVYSMRDAKGPPPTHTGSVPEWRSVDLWILHCDNVQWTYGTSVFPGVVCAWHVPVCSGDDREGLKSNPRPCQQLKNPNDLCVWNQHKAHVGIIVHERNPIQTLQEENRVQGFHLYAKIAKVCKFSGCLKSHWYLFTIPVLFALQLKSLSTFYENGWVSECECVCCFF